MSSVSIKKAGITTVKCDAIVNAANSGLCAGGGVCGVIFSAAGYGSLQAACDAIGYTKTGSAAITPSFGLSNMCKYIIHAVGPVWMGGTQNEPNLLYSSYMESLKLAKENDCHSIAFPLISSGIYGYPVDKAWRKALKACKDFIEKNKDYSIDVVFCVIDDDVLKKGLEVQKEI